MEKWKTLKSEYLYRRPWLTARRDAVQLPNGQIHDEFYILEYPNWVNIIAITPEGNYVFVRQYRHGLGEILVELCAGVVEDGEDILAAAQRELEEETGYTGGTWTFQCALSPNASATTNMSYTFLAEGVVKTSAQHLDRTEDIEVLEMSRQQVVELLLSGEFKQATMAAPLWRHFALAGGLGV